MKRNHGTGGRGGGRGPRRQEGGPRRPESGPSRREGGPHRREGGPRRRDDGPRRQGGGPQRREGGPRREPGGPPRRSDGPRHREAGPRRPKPISHDAGERRAEPGPSRRGPFTGGRDRARAGERDDSRHRRSAPPRHGGAPFDRSAGPKSRPDQDRGKAHDERPSAAALRSLFTRSGLRLSEVQTQQFWTFHQLLRRRNDELDLTRLHAFETIVLKHYVDCALIATLVDLPSPLLDLGSGAGFPGIPLKIVRPDVKIWLAEPRHKRVEFLEEAIRELGLRDIEVVPHRIGPSFDIPIRGVVTRAVESIPSTLERVAPWLGPGARLLFMKGPSVDVEIEAARRDWSEEFRVLRDVPYSIPATTHARRLVVFERTAAAVVDVEAARAAGPKPAAARFAATLDDRSWDDDDAVDDRLADQSTGDSDVDDDVDVEPESAPATPASDERATHAAIRAFDAAHAGTAISPREVRELASAANPTYKLLRAVLAPRGVRKHQRALVAGIRPILEVLRDHPERAVAWITQGASPAPPVGARAGMNWLRVAPEHFRGLDPAGTGGPLLLIDAPPLAAWSDTEWPEGCTLFVPFQDPDNVGAVLRTAAAFGVAQVVLLREAANPFHPKSARAAGSALVRLPIRRGPDLASFDPHGAPVYALSPGGQDVGHVAFPARFGLLLGLEGPGLPERWRGERSIAIPMSAGTDSLNAAAAAAIALYLWARERDTAQVPGGVPAAASTPRLDSD